ncbi:phage tail tube protein [Ketogulonicigenium vulgare]|uniref:phage tail tube protein n=1 Tax=Ketogulonicigenium vulgare TaxID=92945 RepID=UPI002359CEC0|nr:phage tail tube protein [Ketogulonicigenium vulgare]
MPASKAITGTSTRFGRKTGTGTQYAYFAEVSNINGIGMTREAIDASHLESPDAYNEFIAGMKTGKPVTITLNFVPAATSDVTDAFATGSGEFRILFPGGTVAFDFTGIVTDFGLGDVSNDKMTATLTVQPSGKPTLGLVAGA